MAERNQREHQLKLQEQMEKEGLDALIVTAPEAIFYCTGFADQLLFTTGRIGSTLAIVPASGEIVLLVSEFEKLAAQQSCSDIRIESYPIWIYIEDYDDGNEKQAQPDTNYTFSLASKIIKSFDRSSRIGIQTESMPYKKWDLLCKEFGENNIKDCESVLRKARVIKTAWEIEVLRENTRLLERVMFNTYKQTQPGMSEVDIYSIWNRETFAASPEIYDTYHTIVFGPNWSPQMIPLEDVRIKTGDILRLDGAVWRHGYGSDLGRACAIGGKAEKPEMEHIYSALYKGYEKLITMVGPGVRMCDVFQEVVSAIQKGGIPRYRRGHVGHSLGCRRFSEEYPFIAPDETSEFKPGMVFCTEVPYYSSSNNSYNLEDTLLVTENGIELFSHCPKTLVWNEIG